jgi:hypothetical protein
MESPREDGEHVLILAEDELSNPVGLLDLVIDHGFNLSASVRRPFTTS